MFACIPLEAICAVAISVKDPRVGLELTATGKTPRGQSAALLPLELGDTVVVRRVFKGTSWVEAEANKRTGLVHLSLLRRTSGTGERAAMLCCGDGFVFLLRSIAMFTSVHASVSPTTSPREDDKKGEERKSPRGPRTADILSVATAVPGRNSGRVLERSNGLDDNKLLY